MLRTASVREGGLKELALLLLPIAMVSLSNCFFLFIEKLLLARLSVEALELAVNANYIVMMFQAPCVALTMMAQVFVAEYKGASEQKCIGSAIWQFIWFSLFSLIFTFPGILIFAEFYFQNTHFNIAIGPYLYFLSASSFLFPLTTSLSCFYLGRGKTGILLWGTLGTQFVKLVLAYLLIFGWEGYFPSLGLLGGVTSSFLAQTGFCCILLACFLNKKNREEFHTFEWKFKPREFWHYIQPGILRAFNRILNFTCWSAIAYLMTSKGETFLLVISVGGSYFLFLPFISEALSQAQVTIISHLLGQKKFAFLNKAFHSGLMVLLFCTLILGIPLLLFPNSVYTYLFPSVAMSREMISHVSFGLWLSFIFYTLTALCVSYILAFKDMNFSLFMGIMGWITGFLFIYVPIQYFSMPAEYFWTLLSVSHAIVALMYYMRMKKLNSQCAVQGYYSL